MSIQTDWSEAIKNPVQKCWLDWRDMYQEMSTSSPGTGIAEITDVAYINLVNCSLHGNIPDSIGQLAANLQELTLGSNDLDGTIPESITQLTNVFWLDLSNNKFTGNIPDSINGMVNLRQLQLQNNALDGPIPESIGELTQLTQLSLEGNQFSGAIPESIGHLINLTVLNLQNNSLTDTIPQSIGQLGSLQYLFAGGNKLRGPIPESIGQLTQLEFLMLQDNELSGPIPESITKLTGLMDEVNGLCHGNSLCLATNNTEYLDFMAIKFMDCYTLDFCSETTTDSNVPSKPPMDITPTPETTATITILATDEERSTALVVSFTASVPGGCTEEQKNAMKQDVLNAFKQQFDVEPGEISVTCTTDNTGGRRLATSAMRSLLSSSSSSTYSVDVAMYGQQIDPKTASGSVQTAIKQALPGQKVEIKDMAIGTDEQIHKKTEQITTMEKVSTSRSMTAPAPTDKFLGIEALRESLQEYPLNQANLPDFSAEWEQYYRDYYAAYADSQIDIQQLQQEWWQQQLSAYQQQMVQEIEGRLDGMEWAW